MDDSVYQVRNLGDTFQIVKEKSSYPIEGRMTSLYDQWTFEIDRFVLADVLDSSPDVLIERINPQAVFFGVDDLDEATSKDKPVLRFDEAFEHGFLDALAIIFASLGNLA